MKKYFFSINITSEQFLAYYQGIARQVIVRATTGQTVRFSAHLLKPYLTHSGIKGRFELVCDSDNKFKALNRVG